MKTTGKCLQRLNKCPKDVDVIIPKICEGVTLYGKGDFTNVTNSRIWKWALLEVWIM